MPACASVHLSKEAATVFIDTVKIELISAVNFLRVMKNMWDKFWHQNGNVIRKIKDKIND